MNMHENLLLDHIASLGLVPLPFSGHRKPEWNSIGPGHRLVALFPHMANAQPFIHGPNNGADRGVVDTWPSYEVSAIVHNNTI